MRRVFPGFVRPYWLVDMDLVGVSRLRQGLFGFDVWIVERWEAGWALIVRNDLDG
jgi:hypothetical protein